MTFNSPAPASDQSAGSAGLPNFETPPVDEVALSVQFIPIAGFTIPHFGLLWNELREEFPYSEIHGPIPNIVEENQKSGNRLPGIVLASEPDVRCWYLKADRAELFQIQRDRMVTNWRKVSGAEIYPRYEAVRAAFSSNWDSYRKFLRSEGLPEPQVTQCEVTYVNHIEYGLGWDGYGELGRIIKAFSVSDDPQRFLPDPERLNMQMSYKLPEGSARLHVALFPVIRARDGEEVLQLTLTARGAPESSSEQDVLSWLDFGRHWVVNGFADFMTDEVQKLWGKK